MPIGQPIEMTKLELIIGVIIAEAAGAFFWLIHIMIFALIFILGGILVPIVLYYLGLLQIQ